MTGDSVMKELSIWWKPILKWNKYVGTIKGALLGLRQLLATERPLKMMEKSSTFIYKLFDKKFLFHLKSSLPFQEI